MVCEECGFALRGTGALRKHVAKVHPHLALAYQGPKFEPKIHAVIGACQCKARNRTFQTFFHLKKHMEDSTCTQLSSLWKLSEQPLESSQVPPAAVDSSAVTHIAEANPGDAVVNPDFHDLLRNRRCLRSQKLAAKGVKQHLNRQRPEVIQQITPIIQPRLDTFQNTRL